MKHQLSDGELHDLAEFAAKEWAQANADKFDTHPREFGKGLTAVYQSVIAEFSCLRQAVAGAPESVSNEKEQSLLQILPILMALKVHVAESDSDAEGQAR